MLFDHREHDPEYVYDEPGVSDGESSAEELYDATDDEVDGLGLTEAESKAPDDRADRRKREHFAAVDAYQKVCSITVAVRGSLIIRRQTPWTPAEHELLVKMLVDSYIGSGVRINADRAFYAFRRLARRTHGRWTTKMRCPATVFDYLETNWNGTSFLASWVKATLMYEPQSWRRRCFAATTAWISI